MSRWACRYFVNNQTKKKMQTNKQQQYAHIQPNRAPSQSATSRSTYTWNAPSTHTDISDICIYTCTSFSLLLILLFAHFDLLARHSNRLNWNFIYSFHLFIYYYILKCRRDMYTQIDTWSCNRAFCVCVCFVSLYSVASLAHLVICVNM